MTQIPRRVFAVWENGINIQECDKIMTRLKLECSKCGKTFGGEWGFKCHIERCLKYHVRDRNHLLHMYCNRLIVLQTRVAKYCGVTEETDYRQCGTCKEEFESYDLLKIHTRVCRSYLQEYEEFMKKTQLLFDNLLLSYDALSNVFQKYKNDRTIINFRENGLPPPPGPYNFVFPKLDQLQEFFLDKYHKFFFNLLNFSHDAFIRYLKKKESNVVDQIDYLQKDPYVNFHRSEEENGADTETDYDSEEDKEDDDDGMDVEVSSDNDDNEEEEEGEEEERDLVEVQMEDAGDDTSGAESENDEAQEHAQEHAQLEEQDGADAAWILEFGGPGIEDEEEFDGLDDDEIVPVGYGEYEENEEAVDEDEYIEVVL